MWSFWPCSAASLANSLFTYWLVQLVGWPSRDHTAMRWYQWPSSVSTWQQPMILYLVFQLCKLSILQLVWLTWLQMRLCRIVSFRFAVYQFWVWALQRLRILEAPILVSPLPLNDRVWEFWSSWCKIPCCVPLSQLFRAQLKCSWCFAHASWCFQDPTDSNWCENPTPDQE